MNRTSLVIDDQLHNIIKELKVRYVTNSTAYLVKLALTRLHENFLPKNVDVSNRVDADVIPTVNLPGMTEVVVRSQMARFGLTAEEYTAVVRRVVDNFAASGTAIKNPEAAIFKACSRYVHERDIQKRANAAAQTTPSADGSGESIYELQDRLG